MLTEAEIQDMLERGDVPALIREVLALRAERDTLRKSLRWALGKLPPAGVGPWHIYGDNRWYCASCVAEANAEEKLQHPAACPWAQAKALLAEEASDANRG